MAVRLFRSWLSCGKIARWEGEEMQVSKTIGGGDASIPLCHSSEQRQQRRGRKMSRQNDGFEFKFLLLQKVLSAFFRVVNVFVRWDRLGYLIGAVNIATLRDRLRRDNLHHAG